MNNSQIITRPLWPTKEDLLEDLEKNSPPLVLLSIFKPHCYKRYEERYGFTIAKDINGFYVDSLHSASISSSAQTDFWFFCYVAELSLGDRLLEVNYESVEEIEVRDCLLKVESGLPITILVGSPTAVQWYRNRGIFISSAMPTVFCRGVMPEEVWPIRKRLRTASWSEYIDDHMKQPIPILKQSQENFASDQLYGIGYNCKFHKSSELLNSSVIFEQIETGRTKEEKETSLSPERYTLPEDSFTTSLNLKRQQSTVLLSTDFNDLISVYQSHKPIKTGKTWCVIL